MNIDHTDIKKAILKSQHCQRNWDLSQSIPDEDLELLKHAVSNCPSKQNVSFYDVYFISDRTVIEEVHSNTNGFLINKPGEYTTNSQTLANLLIAFTDKPIDVTENNHRNTQLDSIKNNTASSQEWNQLNRDADMAIGIAAGYVNLVSSILGYSTGCCACFDSKAVKRLLNTSNNVRLLMGVGFSNSERNRRIHHLDESIIFPTKKKQEITVYNL